MNNQDYLKMEEITKNFLDTLNLDEYLALSEDVDTIKILIETDFDNNKSVDMHYKDVYPFYLQSISIPLKSSMH